MWLGWENYKLIYNFCGETSWKTLSKRPRRRWEDYIKVNPTKIGLRLRVMSIGRFWY
jgi:hypothetical protein